MNCNGDYTRFDIKIKKCLSTELNVHVQSNDNDDECTIASGTCFTSSFNIVAQPNLNGQFYLNLYDDSNDCSTNPTVFIFDCNVITASNITDYGAFNVRCYDDNESNSSASKQPISIKKLASLIIFISSIILFIL